MSDLKPVEYNAFKYVKESTNKRLSILKEASESMGLKSKDEVIQQLAEALRQCDEAMEYMSEYDIPIMLPDNVKQALAAAEPFLRGKDD